jgi:DeoR family fructose operon transcriptional repressor
VGAVSIPPGWEPSLPEKAMSHRAEKAGIARYAAAVVQDATSVLLDAGTTTGMVAKHIPRDWDGVLVTNGLNVINALVSHDKLQLVVLGGSFRQVNQATVGPAAEEQLRQLRVDVALIGAYGITPEVGITSPTALQASLKSRMMASAARVMVLADASKFRKSYPFVSPLPSNVIIVTDAGIDDETKNRVEEAGWTLVVCRDEPLAERQVVS